MLSPATGWPHAIWNCRRSRCDGSTRGQGLASNPRRARLLARGAAAANEDVARVRSRSSRSAIRRYDGLLAGSEVTARGAMGMARRVPRRGDRRLSSLGRRLHGPADDAQGRMRTCPAGSSRAPRSTRPAARSAMAAAACSTADRGAGPRRLRRGRRDAVHVRQQHVRCRARATTLAPTAAASPTAAGG